ncbi:MAG: putative lipid II flippase FtsW [Fibrobacteria bacterium]|nr:putative lipid II flippase FtsW [Fibrobacteria bacterium]
MAKRELKKSRDGFHFDTIYLGCVLALVGLGIVIIYSSSGEYASSRGLPDTFFLVNHLKKIVIAAIALLLGIFIDFRHWKKFARPLLFIVVGLLIFLVTSSQISGVHGAKRWISIASFGLQPSELAKVALIFFMARFLTEKETYMHQFKKGLLAAMVMSGLIFLLVLLQPDYSSAAIILCISIALIFIGGARLSHMALIGVGLVPVLAYLMISSPYRLQRVMAFIRPGENVASSYQSVQALISLGNGGIFGTGLGAGTQKLGYLPMPFTDTIFSILGEELGLVGTLACLLLFGLVIWRGIRIAYNCEDRFGSLAAVGIVVSIAITVIMHIGVCAGFFPTTGQPLPFVSYGGTALCMMMFLSGVMLNISGNKLESPATARNQTRETFHRAMAKQRIGV